MTAANKTFSVTREDKPSIHVTGFLDRCPFINIRVGDSFGGEFQMILYMADARALVIALESAINHAEPRAAVAADLGITA